MAQRKIKRIAVYCGAAAGNRPEFQQAAREVGAMLARSGIELVYGAGCVGLMGILADSALENGGSVIGVVPRQFISSVVHKNLAEIFYTNSMAERKRKMAELADAHIALAGGFGTLDEISEALALLQLGISNSPCGFLNTAGFYDNLEKFLAQASESGVLAPNHFSMALFDENPERLLERLAAYKRPREKRYWKNSRLGEKI